MSLAQILKHLVGRGDLADCVEVRAAFPFDPRLVPQTRDLFNLFDTTPDLSGADIDIGPFIRDGADLDVLVFWRDDASGLGPGDMWKTGQRAGCPFKKLLPAREELCPVAAWRFRKFFEAPGKVRKRVWARDWRKGWVKLTDPDRIYPGQLFLLHSREGGYDAQVGWTGDPNTIPELCMPPAPPPALQQPPEEASASGDSALDDEDNAVADWQSVHDHSVDVARELGSILNDIPIVSALGATGLTAPLKYTPPWHDAGKAHGKFPAKLTREARGQWNRLSKGDHPAKAPKAAWKSFFHEMEDAAEAERQFVRRPGFRHELASALALLETLRLARSDHAALIIADELRAVLGTPENGSAASEAHQEAARTALGHILDLDRVGFNLLLYLVACHHGKVRLGLRSTEEDYDPDQRDPVPETEEERPLRRCHGVQDGDAVSACRLPATDAPADIRRGVTTLPLTLALDPMEAFSVSYGASWADRMRELLEVLGPFRLGYLEVLIRAADQRASANPTGVSLTSSGDPREM